MFNGAHVVIYSTDAEADRAFIRDVLGLNGIDVGRGWLIFSLPPAEVAIHPHSSSQAHELYLMCDDLNDIREKLHAVGVASTQPSDEGWGILSSFQLPGGGTVGFYQPCHDRP